jgi:hypothetical protein
MNTKKPYDPLTYVYPRTLESAFGPYERWGEISLPEDEYPEMTLPVAMLTYFGATLLAFLIITAIAGLFQ